MSVTLSRSRSDLRASQESKNELTSSQEFVRLEKFLLIPDYFAAPTPKIDSVEIVLEGRSITIYGISEEEQVQEFQSVFKDYFVPVVKNEDLKATLDRFIIQELKNDLKRFYPETQPPQVIGKIFSVFRLASEEREAVQREIVRFDVTQPGKVRQALARLQTGRAKKVFLESIEPIALPHVLLGQRIAIKIKHLKDYLMIFATPDLQPRELGMAIRDLPEHDRQVFRTTLRFIDQREGLFENLPPHFTSLERAKFALGEELYDRIEKKIPIKWKLAQEKVERLHGLIGSHIETLRERNWCESAAQKIFQTFEKVQDHYIEDEALPYFIPILSPWLTRVEKVKQALRDYFDPLEDQALTRLENVCCETELVVEFREMGETISLGGINPGQHLFHHIRGAYSAEFLR